MPFVKMCSGLAAALAAASIAGCGEMPEGASNDNVVESTSALTLIDGGWYQFSADSFFGTECIGAWNGSTNNGTQLLAVSCTPYSQAAGPGWSTSSHVKDQAWMFNSLTDCIPTPYGDYCSIRNGADSSKCMGTYAGSPNNGAYIVLWDCLGKSHQDQYWQVQKDVATGYYKIWNLSSGLGVTGSKVVCDPITGNCVNHLYDGTPIEWKAYPVTP